jgi:peptidoglycan/xylan/chitin deacetylase (PgdA/CDA1 family)
VIAVKVTDTTALKNNGTVPFAWATVYAGSDTNASAYTNGVSWSIGNTNDVSTQRWIGPDGTWILLSLYRNTYDAAFGTIDWTSIKAIRFRLNDAWISGNPVAQAQVRVGFVGIARDTKQEFPNGVVTFCLDDGLSNVYSQAFPIFASRNIAATAFLINDVIDTDGFVTTAHVNEMVANGWDAAIHGEYAAHVSGWVAMSPTDRDAMLARSVAFHAARGWDTRHCAYPEGRFDGPTVASVLSAGLYGRTTYGMYTSTAAFWEMYPPVSPGKLVALSYNGNSVGSRHAWIDAIKAGRHWGIFNLHNVVTTASSGQEINQYDLVEFLEYVVNQDVTIRTMSQMIP